MSESLRKKTLRSVGWNALDRVANYGISFIVSIVLARLLSPSDYGLIGIIGIFIAIFNTILDGGLSTALIRKEEVSETDYNTVFYSNIVTSISLTIALFLGAPLISSFFNRPEITLLIETIAFILIINALSIIQQVILVKKLDFKTQTKISVFANITSGVIGIVLAYLDYGVWALVIQQLTSRVITTTLLWIYNKWLPKIDFSSKNFKELFGFGWKLLLSRLITSIWGQIYHAVIGKYYSPQSLGLYTRASQYGQLFSSGIADVILKVSLPVMSSIQNNDDRLISATREIIKQTMFVTFFLLTLLAACSKSFILVLIGEKWIDCVPYLQILCFNLMINPLAYINENLLTVKGKSDKILILQIAKIVLTIAPILLGIFINIFWMLISSAIISWMCIFLYTYYTNKYFCYNWKDQFIDILPSFLISISVGLPVYAISYFPVSPFILLPLQLLVGFCLIILICEIKKFKEYLFTKNIIIDIIKKYKSH